MSQHFRGQERAGTMQEVCKRNIGGVYRFGVGFLCDPLEAPNRVLLGWIGTSNTVVHPMPLEGFCCMVGGNLCLAELALVQGPATKGLWW